jgi:hypothetical protein
VKQSQAVLCSLDLSVHRREGPMCQYLIETNNPVFSNDSAIQGLFILLVRCGHMTRFLSTGAVSRALMYVASEK